MTADLFDNLFAAEPKLNNCGIIVIGDFNHSGANRLSNHFKLKQLVKFPTRGQATLDVILITSDQFSILETLPQFGPSDNHTIIVKPKERVPNQRIKKTIQLEI